MAYMCYYGNVILHLQQYSHRLDLFYFFFILERVKNRRGLSQKNKVDGPFL